MKEKIRKIGNSWGVIIKKPLLELMGITDPKEELVDIDIKKKSNKKILVLRKAEDDEPAD